MGVLLVLYLTKLLQLYRIVYVLHAHNNGNLLNNVPDEPTSLVDLILVDSANVAGRRLLVLVLIVNAKHTICRENFARPCKSLHKGKQEEEICYIVIFIIQCKKKFLHI